MTDTSIEWCHMPGTRAKTWNPTDGCEVCSPGCANCYAMRMAGRFSAPGRPYHGLVTIAKNKRAVWNGQGRFNGDRLALPLSWQSPCTVFVNSMSDLFYDAFTNEQIAAVFGVMAATPRHTYIVLTKRARRMREWFEWATREHYPRPGVSGVGIHVRVAMQNAALAAMPATIGIPVNSDMHWPLRNVWLGVSVEDRKHGLPRIDDLREVPAAVRMLSIEPLLEDLGALDLTGIGWAVLGCESGPGARPMPVSAARSVRDQCAEVGVPFFLKQACSEKEDTGVTFGGRRVGAQAVVHAGTGSKCKPGGVIGSPYLDGVQHLAFPEVRHA